MTTNKRHKHYDVIVAAAEGSYVQWLSEGNWITYTGSQAISLLPWYEDQQYRIKPTLVEKWRFTVGIGKGVFTTDLQYKSAEEVLCEYRQCSPDEPTRWAVPLEPTKIVVEE